MAGVEPHAVIFDMDGLIFDTETLYQTSLLQLAQTHGLPQVNNEAILGTIGLSWNATRDRFANLLGSNFDVDCLMREWASSFLKLAETQLEMKAGVIELLDALDERAIPSAIATGSYGHVAEQHLRSHKIIGRFVTIVTHEDCPRGKPAPDIFIEAATRLQVAPERCWVLEDSINGIKAAQAAGMIPIMIPDLLQPTEEILPLCKYVLGDLHRVRELLIG